MPRLIHQAAGALISALREVAGAAWEVNPFLAARDLLNRWGTYRLRRHPVQVFMRVAGMGAIVWIIYYCGNRWLRTPMITAVQGLSPNPFINEVLTRTAGAIFSSLNIISCVSVAAIWGDLRHMARDGHMESLQVVPGRLSAPALYYGIATRYLPLALVALLIFFFDPKTTPFRQYPFEDDWLNTGVGEVLRNDARWNALSPRERLKLEEQLVPPEEKFITNPWTIHWPFISIGAMLLFCVTNFFMDTAVGFWVFCRFRLSLASVASAMLIVGAATPVFFMAVNAKLENRYSSVLNTNPFTLGDILETYYFAFSSAISLVVGWGLLTLTALRWRRLQSDSREDPVLLRAGM